MPAVRDESVTIPGPPQAALGRASGGGRREFDHSAGRGQSKRHHLNRQREAAERRTHFDSSAMTIMRAEAAATIFSRNSAPPPPLIRVRSGPISSAPSTVRSSSGVSSRVVSGTPSRSAALRVASDVGTAITSRPARTSLGQKLDKIFGGRTGAEAEPHAWAHPFDRTGGGSTFLGLDVHRATGVRKRGAIADVYLSRASI